jgi:UDP-glucose 4-epimerase
MRSLVLGGNGFIGSHVVDHLKAAGHAVRVLDRERESGSAPQFPGWIIV